MGFQPLSREEATGTGVARDVRVEAYRGGRNVERVLKRADQIEQGPHLGLGEGLTIPVADQADPDRAVVEPVGLPTLRLGGVAGDRDVGTGELLVPAIAALDDPVARGVDIGGM